MTLHVHEMVKEMKLSVYLFLIYGIDSLYYKHEMARHVYEMVNDIEIFYLSVPYLWY